MFVEGTVKRIGAKFLLAKTFERTIIKVLKSFFRVG